MSGTFTLSSLPEISSLKSSNHDEMWLLCQSRGKVEVEGPSPNEGKPTFIDSIVLVALGSILVLGGLFAILATLKFSHPGSIASVI